MNLAQLLTDSAERDGDHIAIKLDDVALTYAQLDGASAHIVGLLREQGFVAGDRVGIMLPNVPYFPVCYYGVLRAGGVVVPMNVLLRKREVAFYLEDSGAKLLFAWEGFAEDAQAGAEQAGAECILVKVGEFEQEVGRADPVTEMADVGDQDTAVILYTSGTTGTPKGAELTHANLTRNAQCSRDLFGFGNEAVTLGALPLFHSFGQTCGLNATVCGGGTLSLIPRFEPGKALEIIERDQINVFQGVPDHVRRDAALPRPRQVRRVLPAAVRLGRLGHAGRADARLRGCLRVQDPRGLRPLRELARGLLQPPRPRAQAGLDRHPDRGGGDEGRRRRRCRGRPGRGRRDRDPRPQRDEGLLGAPRGDRGDDRAAAGCTPATWRASTRTATSSSSTARRT